MSIEAEDGRAEARVRSPITEWSQGDFTLEFRDLIEVGGFVEDGFPELSLHAVEGLVVVTQTCDVVNTRSTRNSVVVCPLVRLDEESLREVDSGTTPSFARLEGVRDPSIAVDLNRMMTVAKSALEGLDRNPGLLSDRARQRFADALSRKHARFAFPDDFAHAVLGKMRGRLREAHKKDSDNGRACQAIKDVRVRANPSWEEPGAAVRFFFVIEDEGTRANVGKFLEPLFKSLKWPDGLAADAVPFEVLTLEQMTALQWCESNEIDWSFISLSRPPAPKAAAARPA